MTIKDSLIKMYPKSLNENELSALLRLAVEIKDNILKIDNDELNVIIGFSKNTQDQVLTSLVKKKMISREQKRDDKGQFTYNEIRITTNKIVTD